MSVRLTLVIDSLTGGGAERVMSVLANGWAAQGHDITLITLARVDEDRQTLDPAVTRIGLDLLSPSRNLWESARTNVSRLTRLRRAIRRSQPQAVISFMPQTNVLTIGATRRLGVPVIVSERVDPRVHRLPRLWSAVRDRVYRQATAVVVQTSEVARWAERYVPVDKVHTIPNPIPAPDSSRRCRPDADGESVPAWLNDPRSKVLAMGRLTPQKGFDVLLEAFAQCHQQNRDWCLIILGEGEERSRLEAMAVRLGIESAVSLPGYVPHATRVLGAADLFVLSSRYEGFPNALLEAMACGLPVISTDCPSGPSTIVRHGVDGLLIPPEDATALSNAMRQLIATPDVRRRLASRAVEVLERFSMSTVMRSWDELLVKCTRPC